MPVPCKYSIGEKENKGNIEFAVQEGGEGDEGKKKRMESIKEKSSIP